MRGVLSVPALLLLAWGLGLLLAWEQRYRRLSSTQLPWLIVAMALVTVAMVVALVGVPGHRHEQFLRGALVVEGALGVLLLLRRLREERSHER